MSLTTHDIHPGAREMRLWKERTQSALRLNSFFSWLIVWLRLTDPRSRRTTRPDSTAASTLTASWCPPPPSTFALSLPRLLPPRATATNRSFYAAEITSALDYMHSRGIVYRWVPWVCPRSCTLGVSACARTECGIVATSSCVGLNDVAPIRPLLARAPANGCAHAFFIRRFGWSAR